MTAGEGSSQAIHCGGGSHVTWCHLIWIYLERKQSIPVLIKLLKESPVEVASSLTHSTETCGDSPVERGLAGTHRKAQENDLWSPRTSTKWMKDRSHILNWSGAHPSNPFSSCLKSIGRSKRHIFLDGHTLASIGWCLPLCYWMNMTVRIVEDSANPSVRIQRIIKQSYSILQLRQLCAYAVQTLLFSPHRL